MNIMTLLIALADWADAHNGVKIHVTVPEECRNAVHLDFCEISESVVDMPAEAMRYLEVGAVTLTIDTPTSQKHLH